MDQIHVAPAPGSLTSRPQPLWVSRNNAKDQNRFFHPPPGPTDDPLPSLAQALKLDKDVVVAAVHRSSEAWMYLPPPCTKDKASFPLPTFGLMVSCKLGWPIRIFTRMECVHPNCWRCWRYNLKMLSGNNHDEFPGLWSTYDLCFYASNSPLQLAIVISSTTQGGGGSFENRKPIGEIGCCESQYKSR